MMATFAKFRLQLYSSHLHMFGEERGGDIRGGVPGPALARGGAARQPARRHRLVPTCPNIFTDSIADIFWLALATSVSAAAAAPGGGPQQQEGGGEAGEEEAEAARGCEHRHQLRGAQGGAARALGTGDIDTRGRILCNMCSKRSLLIIIIIIIIIIIM